MAHLQVRQQLPLGLAWNWVKFSFAAFREKPINFLGFSLAFIIFSIAPFIGSFLNVLVLARIYLSAEKVIKLQPLSLGLNLIEILKRRNIINFAVFNIFFDLILMSIFQEMLLALGVKNSTTAMLGDHRLALILLSLSIFRIGFFGISLSIITFNPQLKLIQALILSWKFLFKHWFVLLLAAFLLLPFLLLPLYVMGLIVLSVDNDILFGLSMAVLLIIILLFIAVTTIFSYKLYKDGIEVNE